MNGNNFIKNVNRETKWRKKHQKKKKKKHFNWACKHCKKSRYSGCILERCRTFCWSNKMLYIVWHVYMDRTDTNWTTRLNQCRTCKRFTLYFTPFCTICNPFFFYFFFLVSFHSVFPNFTFHLFFQKRLERYGNNPKTAFCISSFSITFIT